MSYYIILFVIILIISIILSLHLKQKKNKNKIIFLEIAKNIKRNNQKHIENKENILDANFYNNLNNPLNYNNQTDDFNDLKKCQVSTLNTEQCYKSREYECPIVNGTHLQCTNNYIPKPKEYNADCGNRTFDMVPYPWKISENCYYNSINFDREKKYNKVKFI